MPVNDISRHEAGLTRYACGSCQLARRVSSVEIMSSSICSCEHASVLIVPLQKAWSSGYLLPGCTVFDLCQWEMSHCA